MTTTKKLSGIALAAAAAAAFATVPLQANAMSKTPAEAHCTGVNACKGKGSCKTANNACGGQNACKGQGYVSMSKEACDQVGGVLESGYE